MRLKDIQKLALAEADALHKQASALVDLIDAQEKADLRKSQDASCKYLYYRKLALAYLDDRYKSIESRGELLAHGISSGDL